MSASPVYPGTPFFYADSDTNTASITVSGECEVKSVSCSSGSTTMDIVVGGAIVLETGNATNIKGIVDANGNVVLTGSDGSTGAFPRFLVDGTVVTLNGASTVGIAISGVRY